MPFQSGPPAPAAAAVATAGTPGDAPGATSRRRTGRASSASIGRASGGRDAELLHDHRGLLGRQAQLHDELLELVGRNLTGLQSLTGPLDQLGRIDAASGRAGLAIGLRRS